MTTISKKAVTAMTAIFATLIGFGESKAQSVSCVADTIRVCDNTEGEYWSLSIDNIPAGYSQFVVYYSTSLQPAATLTAQTDVNSLKNNRFDIRIDNHTLSSVSGGVEAGMADITYKIVDVQFSNSAFDRVPVTVKGSGQTTWRVFGTPVADDNLPDDDPHRLSVISPLNNCGYEATIQTENTWANISKWRWIVADKETFSIIPNGSSAELSTPHYANGHLQTDAKTIRVTIVKTVGGLCSASIARDFTRYGSPEVNLYRGDGFPSDAPILICSSIDEDENSYIDAEFSLAGHAPFTVTLNTGHQTTQDIAGTGKFRNLHITEASLIAVAEVIDRNGCKATEETTHGEITVLDRKPHPQFPTDTIACQETHTRLSVIPTDEDHSFKWGVAEKSKDIDARIYGTTHEASASSTMWSTVDYYVIETADEEDYDDDMGRHHFYAACPSDSAFVTVNYTMPLRYPNGFSPNGDGHNDRLIIEGLPPENMITVVDRRGKKVFEATNYRNNWKAEGVDDGYYVYFFKGQGIKTVKETLAIKRTK